MVFGEFGPCVDLIADTALTVGTGWFVTRRHIENQPKEYRDYLLQKGKPSQQRKEKSSLTEKTRRK